MELWDAYDAQMNIIAGKTLVRGEKIADGMHHLVCDILVKHVDGTYLLMQRDTRKHYGGMWEATAGGSALKGETPLDCARRELYEETGIVADELTEVGRMTDSNVHAIYVEFVCITDCNKDAITLQEGETIAYRWVTLRELINMRNDQLVTKRMQQFVSELR